MSSLWETGFMVREPSWHRLERSVLATSPTSWQDARREAGLDWDVQSEPVYAMNPDTGMFTQIPDWQQITRDDLAFADPSRVLAVQPSSYAVINNTAFGEVINAVVGLTVDDDPVVFEALFALRGGRQIVALLYFQTPLEMGGIDGSKTYTFLCLVSRHDGNGGLRGIPTNVRVQCANTLNTAEFLDGRSVGFTIRHTANWDERVADAAATISAARGDSKKWVEFANQLANWSVTNRQRDTYLRRLFPVSDDMGERMADNQLARREQIRAILASPTCADLGANGYQLLMATTEWTDYYRSFQTTDSLIGRQLLEKQEPKAKGARILRDMARLKTR